MMIRNDRDSLTDLLHLIKPTNGEFIAMIAEHVSRQITL